MYKCLKAFTFISLLLLSSFTTHGNTFTPQPTLAPMLKQVMPSVVNLKVEYPPHPVGTYKEENTPHAPESTSSVASGVIVDAKNGYIITNNHVITGAEEVIVTLDDGRTFTAKPVGGDPASDIAVIQIKGQNLQAIELGDSDTLAVGDFVVAIGNPFGLEHSVTSGIVSGLGRTNLGIDTYENFIQTDASINPGNSGGALVNTQGQLVGINTAILSAHETPGNIGIGLAIPINMAHSIMLQLIKFGKVQRGVLGIIAQPLSPEIADFFQLTDKKGALVSYVAPDSLAQQVGLRPGDIVLSVNNKKIDDSAQMRNILGLVPIDTSVSITLFRNKKEQTLEFTMLSPQAITTRWEQASPLLEGLELGRIDQDLPAHGHVMGLQVFSITPDSPAAQAQLAPGDIIERINQQPVYDFATLKDALSKKTHTNGVLLHVIRGHGAFFTILKQSNFAKGE